MDLGLKRSAFTVIELLAASALAALMLAAVSGVLATLSRQRSEIMSQNLAEPWQGRLVAQLEWDFANARFYESSPKQLTLTGYGGRNFVTQTPNFCRAEICYQVIEIGGRTCLARRETHPDDLALDNSRTELVCMDVSAIHVRPLDAPLRGNRPPSPGTVPRRLSVKLHRQASDQAAIDFVVNVY